MDSLQREAENRKIEGITELHVEVEGFSGPLDLLCTLVESRQIDVKKINLSSFIRMYSNFLYSTERASISAISDFISAAAIIVLGKVSAIVPVPDVSMIERDEKKDLLVSEENLEDILERYRPYRYSSFLLEQLKADSDMCYKRAPLEDVPMYDLGDLYGIASLWWSFYRDMSNRKKDREEKGSLMMEGIPFAVPEEQQVENRMSELEDIIWAQKETDLRSILGGPSSAGLFVVTLLALLELARLGRIKVFQERLFGNVRIVRNSTP